MPLPNASPADGLEYLNEAMYAVAAAYAILVYDWLLTFDEEYRLIIRARWTFIKVAFLSCRYYTLLYWPIIMWSYFGKHSMTLCTHIILPSQALLVPLQITPQAVMLMRAYAFTGRKKVTFVVLFLCYLTLVGVTIWGFCANLTVPYQYFEAFGDSGCFPQRTSRVPIYSAGMVMAAALMMELVSLLVVGIYCWRNQSTQGPLGRTFIKQGLGAFALMFVASLSSEIIYFSSANGLGLPLILILPNILACRIILQLRHQVYPTNAELEHQHSKEVERALGVADMWILEDDHDP